MNSEDREAIIRRLECLYREAEDNSDKEAIFYAIEALKENESLTRSGNEASELLRKKRPHVSWIEWDEEVKYVLREGFYYVAIPINPIEGCVTRIVRFNGTRWYDRYNYPINKHARNEWVAIAEIPYPKDYNFDWKEGE